MRRLNDVLENREDNYILPFFWQHGEEEPVLREYMQKIAESGIRAVCVESRPHPDFAGPRWWHDLDIIMDEARRRAMRVWILDDSHFPTGYAVGRIESEYPEYQKVFLKAHQQDFVGPQQQAGILVKWALRGSGQSERPIAVGPSKTHDKVVPDKTPREDRIIGVVAARKTGPDEIDASTLTDLTSQLHDGVVYWDIPDGRWRIFTLVETIHGGEQATEGYLNPLVPEATKVLIDTVYETHYARYQQDFGHTLAGFFSDEPRFGNVKGPLASIGRMDMVLPWRADLPELLKDGLAGDVTRLLPLLWADAGDKSHEVRYRYMDLITRLYAKHFTDQLGNWCRERGVEYIGHVIEDNNAHARLGYGAGHFYRSLGGQDMSGIDVVLHQIVPGMDDGYFKSFTSTGWDGEFFHYGLAKMGASLGHLDPKKQGRTMCEVYGAYGFAEGLKLMKWITDHMLVRGVNYFVPHAFSAKPYPDPDCPPHFYANGQDPQYRYLSILSQYMNRVSHLLSGGKHTAPAAILYHAEAEWSGQYMLFQKPARELLQHQIDFDVVSAEMVLSAKLSEGRLQIADEQFACLIIPYAEALPAYLVRKLTEAAAAGLRIFFLEGFPDRTSEGVESTEELEQLRGIKQVEVLPLKELADRLHAEGLHEIKASEYQPYLRYYRYLHGDGEVYMFFNEDPVHAIDTTVCLPERGAVGEFRRYDAFANQLRPVYARQQDDEWSVQLRLAPYESLLLVRGQHVAEDRLAEVTGMTTLREPTTRCVENADSPNTGFAVGQHDLVSTTGTEIQVIEGKWQVSLSRAEQYPAFEPYGELHDLTSLAMPDRLPTFSGTVRYEIHFDCPEVPQQGQLVISEAYEVAQVWLNGVDMGIRICPPYVFDIDNLLSKENNHLVIEVTNTLGKEQRDFLSQYLLQEPTGIVGQVAIHYSKFSHAK
ncbi:hypothetical protein D3C74_82450 [compost metagenome]